MELEEVTVIINFAKWLVPAISFLFFSIISLLIYIWKNQTKRTDLILERVTDNLNQLRSTSDRHDERLKNLEKIE